MADWISVIVTNIFVCFCWIFFRADSFDTAVTIITRMVTFSRGINHIYTWTFFALGLMVVCYIAAYIHSKGERIDGYYKIWRLDRISSLVILFVMIGLTIGLAYTGSSPFIYFQF